PYADLSRSRYKWMVSPRRRLMFLVLAVVAAVSLTAVTIRVALSGGTREVPDQADPGTVLLVPGYGGNVGALQPLAGAVRGTGRPVVVVDLPGDGTGDLRRQADALDAAAERALRDAKSVDVIGYSAGGVVARLWVEGHDGRTKARRVITLGSPHHGAQIAAA